MGNISSIFVSLFQPPNNNDGGNGNNNGSPPNSAPNNVGENSGGAPPSGAPLNNNGGNSGNGNNGGAPSPNNVNGNNNGGGAPPNNNSGNSGNVNPVPEPVPPVVWTSYTACEKKPIKLSCPAGQTLAIKNAMYGRADNTTCPHSAMSNTACFAAPNKMQALLSRAQGKQSVDIASANNDLFGDPCSGTYKYTQFEYACVDDAQRGDETCDGEFTFSVGGACVSAIR